MFNAEFERKLWRNIACNLGLLPDVRVDYVHVPDAELRRLKAGDDAEWLQEPWETIRGRRLVRGSRVGFAVNASGGPRSRYVALSGVGAEFDRLREGFLFEACGGEDLSMLLDAIGGTPDLGLEDADMVRLM